MIRRGDDYYKGLSVQVKSSFTVLVPQNVDVTFLVFVPKYRLWIYRAPRTSYSTLRGEPGEEMDLDIEMERVDGEDDASSAGEMLFYRITTAEGMSLLGAWGFHLPNQEMLVTADSCVTLNHRNRVGITRHPLIKTSAVPLPKRKMCFAAEMTNKMGSMMNTENTSENKTTKVNISNMIPP